MTRRAIRKFSLILALLPLWFGAGAEADSVAPAQVWSKLSGAVFEHLGQQNGLPNSLATSTAEDGDGFLWVGTPSGLARWDGYHFHSYPSVKGDAAKITDNFIQCLFKDAGGHLWAGLTVGGLARYDRTQDRFVVFPLDPKYPTRVVRSLADDGEGGLWVGTENGLDHLPAGAPATERTSIIPIEGGGPKSQRVVALLRDRSAILWAGTAAGLYRFDQSTRTFIPVPVDAAKTPFPNVSALFEDSEGRLWIGTATQGAFVLERGGNVSRAVQEGGKAGAPLERQWVTAIKEIAPGQIWFGTRGQGIVSLDVQTGWTQRLLHNRAQPAGLQGDYIGDLCRDQSGQIWVSSTVGLDRFDPSRTAISTLFGGEGGGNLSKLDVWSVLPVDRGRIWLGLGDEGINIVEQAEGRIVDFAPPPGARANNLPHATVRALAKTARGDIFAGTLEGLFRIDGTGVTRVTVAQNEPEMGIDALMMLDGDLWVGSRNDGLWKLGKGSEQGGARIGRTALTDQRVLALAPAPNGHIWIGTRSGLNLLDPVTEEIERIIPDSTDPQSLSANQISSLLTDKLGRLWLSTEGGGINLLEERDTQGHPRFRHFGTAQGIPHNNVDKLLMDKSGKIWASTDDGLAMIDPDSFAIRAFRRAEGVAIPTYWINAGDVTEQGDLLFGGVGGLTVVHPDRISGWSYVPPVVVTDLHIGGKAVPVGQFSGPGARKSALIKPDANSLAVEFAALDFSAPERNRYAYKLEGFDPNWIETDSAHRLASYTNLRPGNYKLRLRGSNRDGIWAEASLDLLINVLPAWYQMLWFKLAVGTGCLILVLILVRSRTAYYRRRQEVLEQRVEVRTTELQTRTDQVKALLDNSGQGFLSFGEDLVIDSEYSLACETMLGLVPAGMTADKALFSSDEKKADLFRNAAEAFSECKDYKRRTVLLSLFPAEIRRDGLMIDIAYRLIGHGRLMAVLTDVTESRRLADKLEVNYRRQDMVVAAVIESRDFFSAVESYRHFIDVELVERLERDELSEALLAETYRTVHTFKGVLRQFNFERSPRALHDFEEVLTDFAAAAGSETVEMLQAATDFAYLRRSLALDLAVVEGVLGSDFVQSGARIAVPAAQAEDLSQLGARLLAGEPVDLNDPEERELLWELSRMHYVGLDRVLHGFDRMVRQLAESQGKAMAPLAVEGGEGILVDPRRYSDFLHSLVHVFRNAVSHGIEKPSDRAAAGKDEAGMILCTVTQQAGSVTIAIADDGAGIDLELLRARLVDIGQPADLPDEAVMQSVFIDDVSTQETTDEISGRGVGLGAVRHAVEALGGSAQVSSAPRRGAVFKFILPLDTGISVAEAAE